MTALSKARAEWRLDESSRSAIRFTLTVAAWVVAFFGLMRVGWVEQHLLLPLRCSSSLRAT